MKRRTAKRWAISLAGMSAVAALSLPLFGLGLVDAMPDSAFPARDSGHAVLAATAIEYGLMAA